MEIYIWFFKYIFKLHIRTIFHGHTESYVSIKNHIKSYN